MGTRDIVIEENYKKIQLSNMWTVLDQEIGGKIPNFMKRLLTCMGYDSILVLGQLNSEIIAEIEKYAQYNFIYDLEDEDEKNDFLSTCPGRILKRAHLVLLKGISELINLMGVKYFADQLKLNNVLHKNYSLNDSDSYEKF